MTFSGKTVTPEAVAKDYRPLADTYEERWQGFLRPVRQWVRDRLPSYDNTPEILDLGCGTGAFLKELKSRIPAARITGVDVSADMLAHARRTAEGTFYHQDLLTVDLPEAAYDIVLSLNVLHHLNDPAALLQKTARHVKGNGTIFLCDFAIDSWPLRAAELAWRLFHPAHHKAFSSGRLEALIRDQNLFEIIESDSLKPDRFWRLQIYRLAPLH